jgi:hypothetical protein
MGTNLNAEKTRTLDGLRRQPAETEWLEFKENHYTPELIGQYLSALSNSARLSSYAPTTGRATKNCTATPRRARVPTTFTHPTYGSK